MKLDTDLIRDILLWCEGKLPDKERSYQASEIEIKDYTSDQILYHVELLVDGEYLNVIESSTHSGVDYFIKILTYDGAQFLEIIKSNTVWKKFKEKAKELGLPTVQVILPILVDLLKKQLGLP